MRGFGQWADYSVVTAELSGLMKLDKSIDDIRQHLGVLGFTGWTGMGIMETAKPKRVKMCWYLLPVWLLALRPARLPKSWVSCLRHGRWCR